MNINKKCLLIAILFTFWNSGSYGQSTIDCANTLVTIQSAYEKDGALENIDFLEACINDGFTKDDKIKAYKLLTDYYKSIAHEQSVKAQQARYQADRLLYLATSTAISIISTQLRPDQKELKGLLAQQAVIFNDKYNGNVYDNDIYNGLYSALQAFSDPLVRDIEGHPKSVRAVESTKESKYIYTGGSLGKILRWDINGNQRLADTLVNTRDGYVIRTIAINTSNNKLLAGGEYPADGKLKNRQTSIDIIDLNSNDQILAKLEGFDKEVWKIIVHPNRSGAFILDNLGKSIKYTDYRKVTELVANEAVVQDIAITSDGNWLLAGTSSGKVLRYNLNNNMSFEEIFNNGSKIRAIAVSEDNFLAVGQDDGNLKVINLNKMAEVYNLVGHLSWINHIKFSSDNQFIATSSNDKTVRLWDRNNITAQPITLSDHDSWVWSVSFSPDNSKLLAGTDFQHIKVYPTQSADMANILCSDYLTRNLTQKEWETYIGLSLPFETTCSN